MSLESNKIKRSKDFDIDNVQSHVFQIMFLLKGGEREVFLHVFILIKY